MNDRSDIDRVLRHWFEDGPSAMPDRVVDVVADRIARQRQRRAWRLPWRLPMNHMMKMGAAIAAVLVLAVVGWNVLPGRSTGLGGPAATPTPSPSGPQASLAGPSASLCPTTTSSCIGLLEPGTHSTASQLHQFTFSVPAGWRKSLDVPGSVNLIPEGISGMVTVIGDWAVVTRDQCDYSPDTSVGRTVDDLVTWLVEHPGLTTTAPEPVTIGGFSGQTLEFTMTPEAPVPCLVRINLFTHEGTIDDGGAWYITETGRIRLYILDPGDGHTVTIHVETDPKAEFDEMVRVATPVVESIVFE